MGAEPWSDFVPYDNNLQEAVDKLKEREFRAGRYSEENPSTIEEAREVADADGTASILDIDRVGHEPDFGVVATLPSEQLIALFGTAQPTRAMIEGNEDFYEEIDRGQGICVIVYDGGKPSEIFLAGYSYD